MHAEDGCLVRSACWTQAHATPQKARLPSSAARRTPHLQHSSCDVPTGTPVRDALIGRRWRATSVPQRSVNDGEHGHVETGYHLG
jgi:hypothetical protein